MLQGNEGFTVSKVLSIPRCTRKLFAKIGNDFVIVPRESEKLHLPQMICNSPLLEFLVWNLQRCLNAFLDLSHRFSFLRTDPQRISERRQREAGECLAVATMQHILVRFQVLLIFWYNFCSKGPAILIQRFQ